MKFAYIGDVVTGLRRGAVGSEKEGRVSEGVLHQNKWRYENTAYRVVNGQLQKKSEAELADIEEQMQAEALNAWREHTHCGPLQFRRALRASGLMDAVKTYLESANEEVAEAWEYATKIDRMDPFILAVQQLLNKTDEEVDNLFKLALTYP